MHECFLYTMNYHNYGLMYQREDIRKKLFKMGVARIGGGPPYPDFGDTQQLTMM